MVTFTDMVEREKGGRNWVLFPRRTRRIVERYGKDVIVLSKKEYARLELQVELEAADEHPAYPWLKRLFGNHCDAVNIIRGLREEGFRIEQVTKREE